MGAQNTHYCAAKHSHNNNKTLGITAEKESESRIPPQKKEAKRDEAASKL